MAHNIHNSDLSQAQIESNQSILNSAVGNNLSGGSQQIITNHYHIFQFSQFPNIKEILSQILNSQAPEQNQSGSTAFQQQPIAGQGNQASGQVNADAGLGAGLSNAQNANSMSSSVPHANHTTTDSNHIAAYFSHFGQTYLSSYFYPKVENPVFILGAILDTGYCEKEAFDFLENIKSFQSVLYSYGQYIAQLKASHQLIASYILGCQDKSIEQAQQMLDKRIFRGQGPNMEYSNDFKLEGPETNPNSNTSMKDWTTNS